MESLQRAALCFVVGHVCCTLSHCLQYRQGGDHTPDLTTALYVGIVCVCVHISKRVGYIYAEREESPSYGWWFYHSELKT